MSIRTLQYILSAIIFLCMCSLAGWYIFLHYKQQSISTVQSGRRLGAGEPQSSALGSAYTNLVSSLSPNATPSVLPVTKEKARLWHVTSAPVAGMGFVVKNGKSSLYFVERGTGYLLSADTEKRTVERLTNTLMPRTYEAVVNSQGAVVLRGLDEQGNITSFLGTHTRATTSTGSMSGDYLPLNIENLAWNPQGTRIAYVRSTDAGSVIQVLKSDGATEGTPFTVGTQGWNMQWSDTLTLIQKTGQGILGSAYELRNGAFVNSIPPTAGLSLVSLKGSHIMTTDTGTSTRSVSVIRPNLPALSAPFATIAEKCTWIQEVIDTKKGLVPLRVACAVPAQIPPRFPDSWYQGSSHTDDTWHIFDTRNGAVARLELPPSTPPLDVENPMTDDGGRYLAFIDSHDKSLWLLEISE